MTPVSKTFLIKKGYMISVNDQYMHPVKKTKTGRWVSYTCKSPSLKAYQKYYKEILDEQIDEDFINALKTWIDEDKSHGLSLEISVGIPKKEIYQHDASNFIKSFEDCLSERLGIDDSRNILVQICKSTYEDENSKDGWWPVRFTVSCEVLEEFYLCDDSQKEGV